MLDLAVVGAGAAGTFVAHEALRRRPEWSIELFERTNRIGGRLQSVAVPGARHPIELGGMRYLHGHRHVDRVISEHGLATHAFDIGRGPDRTVLRGVTADGLADPRAGSGYELAADEAGRSAGDLITEAFERIVPGATRMDLDAWLQARPGLRHKGRPLTDWAIGEALASVLSPAGHRFVNDAFGYDSGLRGQNAADAIPYLLGAGDPSGEARTPDAGMQAIPLALAAAFLDRGGGVRFERELQDIEAEEGGTQRLLFTNGDSVVARRVALALPAPSLRHLARRVRQLGDGRVLAMLDSVDAWDAAKLYLWFDRPWWRDDGFLGMRITTDLPPRKIFAFDEHGVEGPSILLGAYTDGRDVEPWASLGEAGTPGTAAPRAMVDALGQYLGAVFPSSAGIPPPGGTAFKHWGADPLECGWHYWRPGADSVQLIADIVQPNPGHELYICGEAFSRWQAWVEGALESASTVVDRLMAP
jgi:lysine 2-monooxygenase